MWGYNKTEAEGVRILSEHAPSALLLHLHLFHLCIQFITLTSSPSLAPSFFSSFFSSFFIFLYSIIISIFLSSDCLSPLDCPSHRHTGQRSEVTDDRCVQTKSWISQVQTQINEKGTLSAPSVSNQINPQINEQTKLEKTIHDKSC